MSAVSNRVTPLSRAAATFATVEATSPVVRHMPQATGKTERPLLPKGRGASVADRVVMGDFLFVYQAASIFTCSAMAKEAVRPGDSMPNRLITGRLPFSAGPAMRKSAAGMPGPDNFGRMPE